MTKKTVLYLSTRYPWPTAGGREGMIAQSLDFLSGRFNVFLAYLDNGAGKPHEAPPFPLVGCEHLQFPSSFGVAWNLVMRRGRALQEALFYSVRARNQIRRIVAECKPDIIIADMIRMAQYVEDENMPWICEMDDLLSVRYRRALGLSRSGIDLTGTFRETISPWLRWFVNGSLRRLILQVEASRMSKREMAVAQHASAVTMVSAVEAARLSKAVPNACVRAIPPTVENVSAMDTALVAPPRLVFVGNLHTAPNRSSVEWIFHEILPILDDRGVEYRFEVIGHAPDALIRSLSRNPRVRFLGFAESLDVALAGAAVSLSPITYGTGIKLKVLAAMARGIPVVTNPVGVEGISVLPGRDVVVGSTAIDIAEGVIRLISDEEFRRKVALHGRKVIRDGFLRERVRSQFVGLVEEAISRGGNILGSKTVVSL